MRWLLDTLGGLWQLLRLGILTRFRFRGDYWQWRLATAFGSTRTATRTALLRSVIDYGRWMHRTRRGR